MTRPPLGARRDTRALVGALAILGGCAALFLFLWFPRRHLPPRGTLLVDLSPALPGFSLDAPAAITVRKKGGGAGRELAWRANAPASFPGLSPDDVYEVRVAGPYFSTPREVRFPDAWSGTRVAVPVLPVVEVHPPATTPEETHLASLGVRADAERFVLEWRWGEPIVSSRDILRKSVQDPAGTISYPLLRETIRQEREARAREKATESLHDAVTLHLPASTPLREVIAMTTTLLDAARDISGENGPPAFRVEVAPPKLPPAEVFLWNPQLRRLRAEEVVSWPGLLQRHPWGLIRICGSAPDMSQRLVYRFRPDGTLLAYRPYALSSRDVCQRGTYAVRGDRLLVTLPGAIPGGSVEKKLSVPTPERLQISHAVDGCEETRFAEDVEEPPCGLD